MAVIETLEDCISENYTTSQLSLQQNCLNCSLLKQPGICLGTHKGHVATQVYHFSVVLSI